MDQKVELTIQQGDILTFETDAIVLKHAGGFHGADLAVAKRLERLGVQRTVLEVAEGGWRAFEVHGKLPARHVLFVGTVALYRFGYDDVRAFGRRAIEALAAECPAAEHATATLHGVHIGLDAGESAVALVSGFIDALQTAKVPPALTRITIVEKDAKRLESVRQFLDHRLEGHPSASRLRGRWAYQLAVGGRKHRQLDERRPRAHVFVAMPFDPRFEDFYYYAIERPVRDAGYLCERVDQAKFTGDIVARIKERIESARLVVADLTGRNANVHLEVGYAWGRNVPTLLLTQSIEELAFDVKQHRCIVYSSVRDLEKKMVRELAELL